MNEENPQLAKAILVVVIVLLMLAAVICLLSGAVTCGEDCKALVPFGYYGQVP